MNIRTIIGAGVLSLLLFTPLMVGAQIAEVPDTGGGTNLIAAITRILNIVLGVAAFVAVIMLVIGGFRYIVSQGDDEQVGKAKGTILYSIIGLIVIALAAAIINFVVGALS